MGTTESIVLNPACVVEMKPPPVTRSIIGDIIGPVKGIVTDAFNEFKGPVTEIVHFVVSNLLTGLIKFITDAIIDIFPGLPNVVDAGTNIIGQLIQIVPAAALALRTAVQTAVDALDGLGNFILKDLDSILSVTTVAFSDLKSLNEQLSYKVKTIISQTAILFDTTGSDASAITSDATTATLQAMTAGISSIEDALETLPILLASGIQDGTNDVCQIFKGMADNIIKSIEDISIAYEGVVNTVITTVGSQLKAAASGVEQEVIGATDELAQLVESMSAEVVAAPQEARRMIGATLNVSRKTANDTARIFKTAATDTNKGLSALTETARDAVNLTDKLITAIETSGKIFAIAVVCGSLLIMFLMFQDLRRAGRIRR